MRLLDFVTIAKIPVPKRVSMCEITILAYLKQTALLAVTVKRYLAAFCYLF